MFLIGCATGSAGLLRFQDRELLIHPDEPVLAYPFKEEVCTERRGIGRIFGRKCETVSRMDKYDLNDPAVRASLNDAVFTCKSKMRFKY